MFKEITLAITLGALLGFGLTGGYLASQKSKKSSRPPAPTPILSETSPTPLLTITENKLVENIATTENTATESPISIISPKNEEIVTNSLLEITGSAAPKTQIIINTSLKHYQTTSLDNGEFKVEIELESGLNNIQIDSFDESDNQSTINLQVTYSTAKI